MLGIPALRRHAKARQHMLLPRGIPFELGKHWKNPLNGNKAHNISRFSLKILCKPVHSTLLRHLSEYYNIGIYLKVYFQYLYSLDLDRLGLGTISDQRSNQQKIVPLKAAPSRPSSAMDMAIPMGMDEADMAHTSDCCTMGVSLMALATKVTTKGSDLSTQGAEITKKTQTKQLKQSHTVK